MCGGERFLLAHQYKKKRERKKVMKICNYKHMLKSVVSFLLAMLLGLTVCGAALAGEEAASDSEEAAAEQEAAGDSADAESDSEESEGDSAETASTPLDTAAIVEEVKGASDGAQQSGGMELDAQQQAIDLEGVANARQLGGIVTEDGRKVKENVLLRSGELTAATDEAIKTLSDYYHVTTVVDLRNLAEINETPDPEINGAVNVHIALRDESTAQALQGLMGGQKETVGDFIERMRSGWNPLNEDMYVNLLETEAGIAGLREFLDLALKQEEGTAILWHCSGGKDRTSLVAVALLTLLGVDKDTILNEFELTNELIADQIESKVEEAREYTDDENELYLIGATASAIRLFMVRAFDYAQQECGSMLDFLKQKCNVTDEEIAALQALYLTD